MSHRPHPKLRDAPLLVSDEEEEEIVDNQPSESLITPSPEPVEEEEEKHGSDVNVVEISPEPTTSTPTPSTNSNVTQATPMQIDSTTLPPVVHRSLSTELKMTAGRRKRQQSAITAAAAAAAAVTPPPSSIALHVTTPTGTPATTASIHSTAVAASATSTAAPSFGSAPSSLKSSVKSVLSQPSPPIDGSCLGIPTSTGDELAFFMNRVNGQSSRCSLRLNTIISGDVQRCVLFNYMIDLEWLMDACPQLQTFPQVDLVTIEGEKGLKPPYSHPIWKNVTYYCPPLPVQFGVHHSKMIILFYRTGVRIAIVTANFIQIDWIWKNNVTYVQDFPQKNQFSPKTSQFEEDLIDYLQAYNRSKLDICSDLKLFDFSCATTILIPHVPGRHSGSALHRYGHMKMRRILSQEPIPTKFAKSPIIAQYSSVGSISEDWLTDELRVSLGASGAPPSSSTISSAAAAATPTKNATSSLMRAAVSSASLPPIKLIWPSVETVRMSLEGWSAGGSLCCSSKNQKPWMRKYTYHWDGKNQGRDRASPHIKSYTRVTPDGEVAWCLITSANLSNAAWGQLQLKNTQLQIRSYELGCLFTPTHYARALQLLKYRNQFNFSCTPNQPIIITPKGDRSHINYFHNARPLTPPTSTSTTPTATATTQLPPVPMVRLTLLPPLSSTAQETWSLSYSSSTGSNPKKRSYTPTTTQISSEVDLTMDDGDDASTLDHASNSSQFKRRKTTDTTAAAASVTSEFSSTPASTLPVTQSSTVAFSSSIIPTDDTYTVICPLPYNPIQLRPYQDSDEPWVWSLDRNTPDVRGKVFVSCGD